MLTKLFRSIPKWQSPKAQKRIEALPELKPENEKDLWVLLKLAREDSEPAVRREAVKFLHDLDTISQIQKRDLEASVRDSAMQRLHDLLAGSSTPPLPLPLRLEHLSRISNPPTLIHLIRDADVMDIRLAAINQLSDEIYLDDIARNSSIARLRLAAAERISTPALLEALAEVSRQKDKNVYKAIRARLDSRSDQEKQQRELREKREALCGSMEAHARAALNPLYAAKAESLRQQWQELQGDDDAGLTERFETAFATAWKQVSEVAAAEQRAADEAQAREEMLQCVVTLETTLGEYQGQADFDLPSLSALRKTQRLRWELATQLQTAAPDLAQRHTQAGNRLNLLEALLLQWQHDSLMVEGTLARLTIAEEEEKQQSLQALHDVRRSYHDNYKGLALPALLADIPGLPVAAPAATPEKSDKSAAQAQLKSLLAAVATFVEAGNSRDAAKKLRKAQELARDQHLHDGRLAELGERVRELKSWAGFAVQPKKEALIAKMQALSAHEMDADDKADAIHALQEEWKALGVADATVEQPLWEQFKAAGDLAFEPCRRHFAAQRELRQQNLEKRIALCEQLERWKNGLPRKAEGDIVDTASMDWKQLDTFLQTARREWQGYQPSDRQKTQPVQERFNALLNALEALRRDHQQQCEAQKRELIASMAALQEQNDLRSACDRAKQLQQQWKGIGQAHPKHDHKLWQEFRAASDALFNKRDADAKSRQQAREASVHEAEALVQAYAALATQDDAKLVAEESARIEAAFRGMELPREKAAALREKFQAARQQLEAAGRERAGRAKREKQEARIQAWAALAAGDDASHAADLILDLEILLELPSPETEHEARLARQMQRLQSRGLRKGDAGEARQLLDTLLKTGVAADQQPALGQRLRAVLDKLGL